MAIYAAPFQITWFDWKWRSCRLKPHPPTYDEFLKSQNLGPLSPKINLEIFDNEDIGDDGILRDTYVSKDLEEYDALEGDSDSESDLGGGYLDSTENPFVWFIYKVPHFIKFNFICLDL